MATVSTPVVPAGIVHVLGATCTTPDCGFHESLHTADPLEATRTARELGWKLKGTQTLCPMCVDSVKPDTIKPRARRRIARLRKVVRA
jgi:hypothetical protein